MDDAIQLPNTVQFWKSDLIDAVMSFGVRVWAVGIKGWTQRFEVTHLICS